MNEFPPSKAPRFQFAETDEGGLEEQENQRSVVEVFVNGRQCVAVRVYPGRRDSTGVSLISRGQESEVLSLDCWQMRNIQGE